MLPRNIIDQYSEHHITLAWRELHERFGFDLKGWKQLFRDQFMKQPRNTTELDYFLIFGNQFINPVLNDILRRRQGFPTFNKFMDYIIERRKD